jgi:TrpR family trp operon transcriptional repressor
MNTNYRNQLISLLCDINDADEMTAALDIFLTQKEHEEVDKRLQIFHLLESQIAQRDIAKQLGVGIATVTRGAKVLRTDSYQSLAAKLANSRQFQVADPVDNTNNVDVA